MRTVTAGPDDIRILSAGAPKAGLLRCAEAHLQFSGFGCRIDFATAPEIDRQLRSNRTELDLVVAPSRAFEDGPVAIATLWDTHVLLGSIATGVAVRDDADLPDLRSPETLRDALSRADKIIFNRASSGIYIEKMIERLGLTPVFADRTVRTDTGQGTLEYLARDGSKSAIAFGQVTEIKRLEEIGIRLAGTLPGELAKTTAYIAALSRTATRVGQARSFLQFLQSERARHLLVETGMS